MASGQQDHEKIKIMKKSWKIMKSVIGNNRKTNQNIKRFKLNNNIIDNELRIANEFNSYFVSVGPTLAAHQIITDLNPDGNAAD